MHIRRRSEDDLMQAVAAGDETAVTDLVRRHRGWVCNLLYAFTRDRDQAEDLTQETFCRVVAHAGDYDALGSFTAWLRRIAVNLGKNHLARIRRITTVSLSECERLEIISGRSDPMALLMEAEVHTQLRQAIQSLPDEQRRVVMLRYFSGMTVQEIAELVQCPEGTVKSRIFHGLRKIRRSVGLQEVQTTLGVRKP